jgi:hypothetical protein
LNTTNELSDRQTIVKWWGEYFVSLAKPEPHSTYGLYQLNTQCYPVWASLALDHLAIMTSLFSSEWAFSSAGITISKCHNHLKGDIVEALQFLKCLICHELVFCADPSVSLEGDEDEDEDILAQDGSQLFFDAEQPLVLRQVLVGR